MALKKQNYSWWRWFDKAGDNCNFTYDETADKWTGTIYIDKVSTGLIEYEPLYVMQELLETQAYAGATNSLLRHPAKPLWPLCSPNVYTGSTSIICRWADTVTGSTGANTPELFLWSIENYPGPTATLVKHEDIEFDMTAPDPAVLIGPTIGGGTGQMVLVANPSSVAPTALVDQALSVRVALGATEEGTYQRTLQFWDPYYQYEGPTYQAGFTGSWGGSGTATYAGPSYNNFPGCTGVTGGHVFAEITFYGQTEGEDVRLDTMLDNLGDTIKNSDFKIFDDVDINEQLPDFIKLNSKRKELLLEWDNIFPFTGSYKALINILKYFGYDQVTLKEYWLNVEEAKGNNLEQIPKVVYKQVPIQDLFSTTPKTAQTDPLLIPSKLYSKTSKFGLFYDITADDGTFDIDGIPNVAEQFLFSNEEILIKLFALKQKLKNYFLPLNARIIDIVGEAVYYARYDVNVWSDLLRVDDIELNINPCVKFLPDEGCSLITNLDPHNFIGIPVPSNINMQGLSDWVVYGIGLTQHNSVGVGTSSGYLDWWNIQDTVSGASFSYQPPPGMTQGQIASEIINTWYSQTSEPWISFDVFHDYNQNVTEIAELDSDYTWLYAVQRDVIGPTSGVGLTASPVPGVIPPSSAPSFVISGTATPGPGTYLYTQPGITFTNDISEAIGGTNPISNYSNAFMGYFEGYDRNVANLDDYPCAPIAAPFVLTNCSFDINWDKSVITWNAVDYSIAGFTGTSAWNNYSLFNYSYTEESYPLGGTNAYGTTTYYGLTSGTFLGFEAGFTGITYSGPPGGTYFYPYDSAQFPYSALGSTPGTSYHPPGPTFNTGFTGYTGPTYNPVLYDWGNLGYQNFNEMQWTITYDLPGPTGATFYIDSGLVSLTDGENYPVLLPYAGPYTVELKLYDSWGGFSSYIKKGALCAQTKDVDFIGHYRSRECDYTWEDKTILRQSDQVPAPSKPYYPEWNMYNSIWNLPLQENEQMSMQDLTYNDLDRIEFYQTQNDPANQGWCDAVWNPITYPPVPGMTGSSGLYDLDAYKWNLIENNAQWDDVCHLWWEVMGKKIIQMRMDSPTLSCTSLNNGYRYTLALVEEPYVGNLSNDAVGGSSSLTMYPTPEGMTSMASPIYGDVSVITDSVLGGGGTGSVAVYQYLGGPTGITGGTSWLRAGITVDVLTLGPFNNGMGMTGTAGATCKAQYKEFVRQFNEEMQYHSDRHPYYSQYLCYYNEEYQYAYPGGTYGLEPYIQFVTKDPSIQSKHHWRLFVNASGSTAIYGPTSIYGYHASGVTGSTVLVDDYWVDSYETVNFGDMGDIPYFFEIFEVGPSGGSMWLPGPSVWQDATTGDTVTGVTDWGYLFGATNMTDLWMQLSNASQGLLISGTGPTSWRGPIRDFEWNIVYGAAGYSGATGGTIYPPPATGASVAIKIQGSKRYFSSYDYDCQIFQGPTSTSMQYNDPTVGGTYLIGSTNCVLGGTSGFAGTMCARSITSNSSWDTLRIHKYAKEFPLLTQIQFNYSLSPMDGKVKPKWTLIKENDNTWVNIYYNNPYFSYTFTQKGSYTLELEIEDNNGNINTETKKEFIKII